MSDIDFQPLALGRLNRQGGRLSSIDPRLSRTSYFDGRLLKAQDLTRDQIYLDERAREIGRLLGSGIAAGLTPALRDGFRLQVSPGLAVAPSGRVLELDRTLEVNLLDQGLIASLNAGRSRPFRAGLYAVAVQYAEVGTGAAEAYPADLASQRVLRVASFAEGVELTLVPLTTALPQGDDLTARAALVRSFMAVSGQLPELPDEAVGLGLLAFAAGRPAWLDLGLVRRPLRPSHTPGAFQDDLAAHYQELLADILESRQARGLPGGIVAAHVFRLLPPFGPLPKAAVDPVAGSHSFFPEGYEVAIAPVRASDLPAIIEESRRLPAMDLERDQDADVMVLVPLAEDDFATRARQLEAIPAAGGGPSRLPAVSPLLLRWRKPSPAFRLDTDAGVWGQIWQTVGPHDPVYVRRPPRAAETGVGAVVLARGFPLPPRTTGRPPATSTAVLNKRLEASRQAKALAEARVENLEQGQYLDRLAVGHLATLRQVPAGPARKAAERLASLLDAASGPGGPFEGRLAVAQILMLVPPELDTALWPTLLEVARQDRLAVLLETIRRRSPDATIPQLMARLDVSFGLSQETRDAWGRLG
ncbi:MAG: hypothetical protein AB1634_03285 [Thermodesulfobacteriota bacterium]